MRDVGSEPKTTGRWIVYLPAGATLTVPQYERDSAAWAADTLGGSHIGGRVATENATRYRVNESANAYSSAIVVAYAALESAPM